MRRYTITWGSSPDNTVSFDCDTLPEPLGRHPYVVVAMNYVISRQAVERALNERVAA
jgi:hypothetical protein